MSCMASKDKTRNGLFLSDRDFQLFSSHGTHKLLKFCGTSKNIFFVNLIQNRKYNFHSHQMAITVLAGVLFYLSI